VLVGRGQHIDAVAEALKGSEVKPIGFVALEPREENGLRDMGPLEQLERQFADVDEVLIADPDFPQDRAVELIDTCHRHGIKVRVAPSTMEILMDRVEFVPGQSLPLFELKPPVFEGIDFFVKRSFDIVGSALGLVFLSPLLLTIAIAVKLTSKGPVLFRQTRVGRDGNQFEMLKFRTMHDGADAQKEALAALNEADGLFKIADDPRITPLGRVLRRTALDELPQLLNVFRGQMSLVGPRPLVIDEDQRIQGWYRRRLSLTPGMTGDWQVFGAARIPLREMATIDYLYVSNWSLWSDVKILLRTIPFVVARRGQ
jgi:exopolysaccharide biosynthesis polyprenyl glycosylphosphotransferase